VIDELDRELAAVGVPARRRRRIRLELEDHLACDPSADLGDPAELARQFADELGTAYARRASYASFLVLVPFGLLLGALFAFAGVNTTRTPLVPTLTLVLGVQLAFVGGTLAVLRAFRLRRRVAIPAAEARVLLCRASVALVGAALTIVVLGLYMSELGVGGRWHRVETPLPLVAVFAWSLSPLAWATLGVGSAAVLVGATFVGRASRLLPRGSGEVGDLSDDLGIDVDPWRLAIAIGGAVALCIAVAGVIQGDPIDGLIRAVGDGFLCLAGFAILGRPLGLRRQPT
jgi:hypothetical protein